MASVNKKLQDKYIRHAVYIERFKAGEAKKISQHLNKEVFPELIDKLMTKLKTTDPSKLKKLWAIRRLKRLTASMDKIIKVGMIKAKDTTVDSLMGLAELEAKWNKSVIEKIVPLDIDMSMPNPEVLRQVVLTTSFEGHKLGTWFNAHSKSVRIGMMGAVKKGIAAGESIPAIGSRLRKVASLKRKQAEYIARTAISSVVNNAKEAVFLRNKDLIKEIQLVATLDTLTTLICINLDGQVFKVGEGPRPPMHFNCRTTTVPVISSWKEYGIKAPPPATRASMTGKVPAKMNYKTWLRKQSKATQIKVLGKKRAELYRSGRVKIDRFVGKDYKPLTLKQIARREGIDIELPAPPLTVKAIPTKGIGKLTSADKNRLQRYGFSSYENIVKAQLGKPLRKEMAFASKSGALAEANKVEKILKKIPGFNGTTYRGLTFKTEVERKAFLSQFEKGGVWRSKSFQSTTKNKWIAKGFAEKKGVTLQIKGRSGRNIAKYSEVPGEKEILFMKGVPLKVDKIVGNKVYLTEITKQAQLKAVPAPPLTVSKVGTTFAKTTSADTRKFINETIDTYPEKVKLALNNRGVSYNVGNSLTEIDPRLKGKRPAGWSKGTTWDNSQGMYNINTKTISVAETYRPVGQKAFRLVPKNRIRPTLNHETGHGFDASPDGLFYSNRSKFKAAYAKDVAKLSKANIIKYNLRYFLQEGVRGRSETFADIFGNLMGGGAEAEIKRFFPRSTKYVKGLLE